MPEYRRLNLRLNLAVDIQRQAWETLSAIPPGHRTEAVCRALAAQQRDSRLTAALREMLREELNNISFTAKKEKLEARNDEEAILGFLHALQEGSVF